MNKGVLQNNSPIQQMMMANVNSNLWNINNLIKPPFISSSSSPSSITNFLAPPPNDNIISHNFSHNIIINDILQAQNQYTMNMPTTSTTTCSSWLYDNHLHHQHPSHHEHPPPRPPLPFPESLSQLLLGGVYMGEEAKKIENWEEQLLLQEHHHSLDEDHLKQENSENSYISTNNNNNVYNNNDQEFELAIKEANWAAHHQICIPTSSPQSCVTTNFNHNSNMLDFSSKCTNENLQSRLTSPLHHVQDHNSEGNNTATSGTIMKKTKVQQSSSQFTLKVRKEKLGDRITALHQLVSPFGKTDTSSVLLEVIGYIRFLQSQVEALSLPYLTSGGGSKRQPHNDINEEANDLRSRGLCLVPLACTMQVGSDNGADYWAPAFGGGFR